MSWRLWLHSAGREGKTIVALQGVSFRVICPILLALVEIIDTIFAPDTIFVGGFVLASNYFAYVCKFPHGSLSVPVTHTLVFDIAG